jgi:hypothetical protein
MAGKKNMMIVTLTHVPLKGKTQTTKVEVPMTATTIGEMAKTLGLDLENRNVSINGEPASTETLVKAGVEVRVTERPQGS